MNGAALARATGIGTALQLAMVVGGHFAPALQEPGFAIGGMGISALAGWFYGRAAPAGIGPGGVGIGAATGGGAIAGGVCAIIGIGVSVLLGDVPASLLGLGTASSVATGAIGGTIARLLRKR